MPARAVNQNSKRPQIRVREPDRNIHFEGGQPNINTNPETQSSNGAANFTNMCTYGTATRNFGIFGHPVFRKRQKFLEQLYPLSSSFLHRHVFRKKTAKHNHFALGPGHRHIKTALPAHISQWPEMQGYGRAW